MNNVRTQGFLSGHLWLAALVIHLMAGGSYAGEWWQYNGPSGDRTSTETIGQITWSQSAPPTPVWTTPTTNGFSSFTIAAGKVFTLVSRYDGAVRKEFCVAFDASTGTELWAAPMGLASYPNGGAGAGDGPRSTPSCDGQRVYAYDAYLHLYCFDAANGNTVWSKNIVTEYAGRNIGWQNAASPLLEGERVIVPGGGAGQSLLAFDRTDGHFLWGSLDEGMTHATPVAATIQGVRQIVFLTQSGLVAVSPDNGTELWRYGFPYNTSTAASPVVWGDYVYCSAAYNVGAGLCRIDRVGEQLQAVQVWPRKPALMNHWSTPVCRDGYLYGLFSWADLDNAPLKCIELLTGNEKWSRAGFGQGGLMAVGDKLVVLEADGDIVVVQATPAAYTEIARAKMLNGKCWSTPILSDNRIYTRSTTQGVCFELSELTLSPTCSIGAASTTITNTGPVDYSVTFSEAVTGFDSADDIQVNATDTAAAGLVAVAGGSGAGPYTVRLSAITGDGTLGITVKASACVSAGGTPNSASAPSGTFTVDNTPPAVSSIGAPSVTLTKSGPADYSVTFSEPVTGFDSSSDIQVNAAGTAAAGAIAVVSGSGAGPYTVRLTTITGNGTLGIAVKASTCSDAAGNNNTVSALSGTFTVDNTPPTVSSIGAPSVTLTCSGPVDYPVTFSEPVTGFNSSSDVQVNTTGTAAAGLVAVVGGSGAGPYTVRLTTITGNGTLGITVKAGACSDAAGNDNTGSAPSGTFTVDNTPPTVEVSLTDSNPTNADTVRFAVNFSESVGASFSASDVVATGTLASGALISVTGGPRNYALAVTPADPNADGDLGIKINSAGVNDMAGNVFAGALSVFYAIDNTVPAVAISPPSVSLTRAGPVSYTLSFSLVALVSTSEDILSSITLNKTGTANGTIGVTGSGNLTRTVTISAITGDGTLSITVKRGTAINAVGTRAAGAGPSEAVTVDNTPPAVSSIGAPSATLTNSGPVDYSVTFSQPVTGFDSADDIQVNATDTAAAGVIAVVGGSDAGPYTVRLSAITGDGTLGITVKAGACSDASGSTNTMSAPSGTFTVDNRAPTAEISLAGSNPTNADTVTFVVNFSESVGESFDGSDVVATGTLASGALISVPGGPQNYTVAATPADPNADGTLGIQIAPAGVSDLAGNVFGGGSSVFYAIDNTVPAVAISPPSVSLTHAGPVSYTLSFSLATFVSTNEDILSSITLNRTDTANGTVGVAGSGNTIRTVTITGITGDGTLSITVGRGTASNAVGMRAAGAGPSEAVTVRSVWPKTGVKYFNLDYR